MKSILCTILLATTALAHGGAPPPPPEPPEPPRGDPIPPGFDPDTPAEPPPPPPAPTPPDHAPQGPTTPPATPPPGPAPTPNPGGPGVGPTVPGAPNGRRGRRGTTGPTSWRLFWDYNREHLLGLKTRLRQAGTVTGDGPSGPRDPLGARRVEVLTQLRTTAHYDDDRTVRAAALLALGRMGDGDDALLMLHLLRDPKQTQAVHEAAAVALGVLPDLPAGETRDATARYLAQVVRDHRVLDGRTRGLALLSAGRRGRAHPALVMALLGRAGGGGIDSEEMGNTLFACGLSGHALAAPELLRAARTGKLGGEKLTDVGRSLATAALGRTAGPGAPAALLALTRSRSVGVLTKRAAILGLARILRDRAPAEEDVEAIEKGLLRVLDKGREPVLRGYAAVALGCGVQPLAVDRLERELDRGGAAGVRPFCALALGLAAGNVDDDRARRVRAFLAEELEKAKDPELQAALSIALGLAGAHEAAPELLERVTTTRLPAELRGAAAQGLGLLGRARPEVVAALETLAKGDDARPVVGDAVLALGLLGRRGVAAELAAILEDTRSTAIQGRIILALGHLGHGAAVEPLLDLLRNPSTQPITREYACVGLGLLGDHRSEDPMFEIDAWLDIFATTAALNELIRLY